MGAAQEGLGWMAAVELVVAVPFRTDMPHRSRIGWLDDGRRDWIRRPGSDRA